MADTFIKHFPLKTTETGFRALEEIHGDSGGIIPLWPYDAPDRTFDQAPSSGNSDGSEPLHTLGFPQVNIDRAIDKAIEALKER